MVILAILIYTKFYIYSILPNFISIPLESYFFLFPVMLSIFILYTFVLPNPAFIAISKYAILSGVYFWQGHAQGLLPAPGAMAELGPAVRQAEEAAG